MRWLLAVWPGVGCYAPPELGGFDGVPVQGRAFVPCADAREDAHVGCVIDGDTFDLEACGASGERIRLLGVDAPETDKPGEAAECFAAQAWSFVQDLLEGQRVTISHDRTCTDVFGRTLAYVWLRGDRLDEVRDRADLAPFVWVWPPDPDEPAILVNEVLLGRGLALDYPEEIAGTLGFQARLDAARDAAEASRLGWWGACRGAP